MVCVGVMRIDGKHVQKSNHEQCELVESRVSSDCVQRARQPKASYASSKRKKQWKEFASLETKQAPKDRFAAPRNDSANLRDAF